MGCCTSAHKVEPKTGQAWKCQQSTNCMSAIEKLGTYPNIISYRCLCELENRVCEACYIFYQQERKTDIVPRISQILPLIRPINSVLVTKKLNAEENKDFYYCYDPKLSRI